MRSSFITSAVPAKLYEVAPNFTVVNMGAMYAGGTAFNKARWDKLPDEVKAAFRKGAEVYRKNYAAGAERPGLQLPRRRGRRAAAR